MKNSVADLLRRADLDHDDRISYREVLVHEWKEYPGISLRREDPRDELVCHRVMLILYSNEYNNNNNEILVDLLRELLHEPTEIFKMQRDVPREENNNNRSS